MDLLKKIPIHYKGELHDVRLVNFSVDINELEGKIPELIKVRNFNGRALISMVDVKLRRMRPVFMSRICHFNYRHIAFRLLVNAVHDEGENKGIFFYRSFTDRPLIVTGGKLFTDYNLTRAYIWENNNGVSVHQGGNRIHYRLGGTSLPGNENLKETVGALDRAYSVLGDRIRVTEIQREKWPLQPVDCTHFQTTFFKSARLEGAFRVCETIYYDWLPPKSPCL